MSRKPAPAPQPVSEEATAIFVGLHAVIQRLRHTPVPLDESVTQSLKGLKPRPRQITALFQLAGDEPISVGELAGRMQISLATASQLVSELADLGLVSRVEDPADRRRTLIEVSGEHRTLVDAVLDLRLRPLEAALCRLTEPERAALSAGLHRLAAELECGDPGSDSQQLAEVTAR
jgi:DNA-binding MarR family transcriptional regulator